MIASSSAKIASFVILIGCLFLTTAPLAEEASRTVMVVQIEDGVGGAVTDELYRTVVASISNHLRAAGFKALHSSAPRLTGNTNEAAADKALLSHLRAENAKQTSSEVIDYVALIQILANMSLFDDGTQIQVEIRGRMLDVNSNETLAQFELPMPQTIIAPRKCDRVCIVGLLRANTEQIANGLGIVLGQRLTVHD